MTTKNISIEGMMCEHCEMHVKEALEALSGVSEAKVSHKDGSAVITYEGAIEDTAITAAVEEAGYEVKKIA